MGLSTILQGAGIGFAIAAPVGPIGLLCIRRTLRDGPAAGLATGLGAATADGAYGLVAAGGLGIAAWLLGHAAILGLAGAALLAWLGFGSLRGFLRRRDGAADAAAAELPAARISPPAAFATTFALTIANPSTILSFVAVIAALGVSGPRAAGAAWWLVAGVFAGSAAWWLILVAAVHFARRALPLQALRWIDLATAIVLLGMAAWAAARVLG
ncbi:MAG: LysE family transporter [Burkholderiaceae bacterium]